MSNGTKILIGVLLILAVIIGVKGAINTNQNKTVDSKQNGEFDGLWEYLNDTKNETKDENNVNKNEELSNEILENNIEENVIGKEEEDSKKENNEAEDRKKAIQMAKDEWAISVDSYDFQALLKDDGIYEVTVISNDSNRTTVAIYTVDVNAETIVEQ